MDIFIYIKSKEFLVLVFFSAMDLLHLIFIVRLVNWNDKRGKIAGGRKFLKIKIFNRIKGDNFPPRFPTANTVVTI